MEVGSSGDPGHGWGDRCPAVPGTGGARLNAAPARVSAPPPKRGAGLGRAASPAAGRAGARRCRRPRPRRGEWGAEEPSPWRRGGGRGVHADPSAGAGHGGGAALNRLSLPAPGGPAGQPGARRGRGACSGGPHLGGGGSVHGGCPPGGCPAAGCRHRWCPAGLRTPRAGGSAAVPALSAVGEHSLRGWGVRWALSPLSSFFPVYL